MGSDIGSLILKWLKAKKFHFMAASVPMVFVLGILMLIILFVGMFVPKTDVDADGTPELITDQLFSQYQQASVDYYNETQIYISEEYFIAADMFANGFVLPENVNQKNIDIYIDSAIETTNETKTLLTPEEYASNLYQEHQNLFAKYINFDEISEEEFVNAMVSTMTLYDATLGGGMAVDGFAWPVNPHELTAPFGWYDADDNGTLEVHNGIDIVGSPNITASADGTVIDVSDGCIEGDWDCGRGYGNYVIIEHNIDGEVYTTMYGHMTDVTVNVGQTVEQGQQIGYMGNTGHSYGVHLHFEIHTGNNVFDHAGGEASPSAIDPLPILNEAGDTETPPAEGE